MEFLSDKEWHVVISGTGLQQSLLALALSRSGKNVLHVDANEYYGGAEAALSLQEAKAWAEKHAGTARGQHIAPFSAARVAQEDADGLAASRSYSLALAPQLIHARSELLKRLVSSKAFRQVEFLAVGSFFIFQPPSEDASSNNKPRLSRIPSTREDVFTNTTIPTRSKRMLMKFLKFVLEYDSEQHLQRWKQREAEPLVELLRTEFQLDSELQSYIVTLTLSIDGQISVGAGLAAINRHLSSMGMFGAGFAAVYPKWGGLAEVAQVGCRAGAVGGAVYMLGVGISSSQNSTSEGRRMVGITLSNNVVIKSRTLIQNAETSSLEGVRLTRLVAIINQPLSSMFEVAVDNAPTPSTAVVAFPTGSVLDENGSPSQYPIYALVHSSDTGECPAGQSVVYLSIVAHSTSEQLLDAALLSLMNAVSEAEPAQSIFRLHYAQACGNASFIVEDRTGSFDWLPADLAFNDAVLEQVQQAWKFTTSPSDEETYMTFDDRENFDEDNDAFDS